MDVTDLENIMLSERRSPWPFISLLAFEKERITDTFEDSDDAVCLRSKSLETESR